MPGVFVFRTLDDCDKILRYTAGRRRAVVIGGGLLGLEVARGLQSHGLAVDIVHGSGSLMNAQLDTVAAAMLKTSVERLGMGVHLEKTTTAILGEGKVSGLAFADGTMLAWLFDLGAQAAGVAGLPDSARVCICHGVSKGAIVACVAEGKRSMPAVMAATRAGTGCGSCRGLVQEIVALASAEECREQSA